MIFSSGNEFSFKTNFIPMPFSLAKNQMLILANPRSDWFLDVQNNGLEAKAILIRLDVLHKWLGVGWGSEKDQRSEGFKVPRAPFALNASMALCLHELFEEKYDGSCGTIYTEAKIMEFLSHFMNEMSSPKKDLEACPFLEDESEYQKIRMVKDILVKEFNRPNKIKDLAKRVGTNEFKLKVGFKHLYGNSVHNYLVDQRLENARLLLVENKSSIANISEEVGYSNPSHFIEAFKKKYGVTPKKLASKKIS